MGMQGVSVYSLPRSTAMDHVFSQPSKSTCKDGCSFTASKQTVCYVVPPHMEKHMRDHAVHQHAQAHSLHSRHLRDMRTQTQIVPESPSFASYVQPRQVLVYDAKHREAKGTQPPTGTLLDNNKDSSTVTNVHNAFDISSTTLDFYQAVFNRQSIDGKNFPIKAYVNYGTAYNNAFFDGREMCYGNGDQQIFTDFTGFVDVGAHEITHGFTQFTSQLVYDKESGQNNESISDVFGEMVRQWKLKQTADQADWLVGQGLFMPPNNNQALRSMKAPGTAYNNDLIGKDPQPATWPDALSVIDQMGLYDPNNQDNDNGGVHIISSIGNSAFCKVSLYINQRATDVGKFSWEKAGWIWYDALTNPQLVPPTCNWRTFAQATITTAGKRFGEGSMEQQAVQQAWTEVGVLDVGKT